MKTRHAGHALFMAVIIAVVSIAPDADAQRRRAVARTFADNSVTGKITDSATGSPISRAEVTIQGATGITDSEGKFKITDLVIGTWPAVVDRWGYAARSVQITINPGENTFDTSLELLPFATVTRTNDTTERVAVEGITWGYVLPFTGTFAQPQLKVCTGDPQAPVLIETSSISSVQGPAQRVETPCCDRAPGEQVRLMLKDGSSFDAIITDSCPPYDIYMIAHSLDTQKIAYFRLSEVSKIEFPQ